MLAKTKTSTTEKLAKLMLKDPEIGCCALAAESGCYCADELLEYWPEFLAEAREDGQTESEAAFDFVMYAIENDL